jgi:penicillin-insensitive murein endopeptidase
MVSEYRLVARVSSLRTLALTAVLLGAAPGCVARGFFTDGSSVSMGRADRGVLRDGHELPLAGKGYQVPPVWAKRGTNYGTDEMVGAIQRAAARVADRLPGGTLGVGDLSHRGGGDMSFHRSHENGRDADLLFYSIDMMGAPLPPADAMPRYRGWRLRGREPYEDTGAPIGRRYFDVPRNWELVAALLEDETIDVEYLFVSEQLRDRMIEYAKSIGAPPHTILHAQKTLKQPRGFQPHDDHLHLRVRCATTDRFQGCVDEGRVRLRSEIVRAPSVISVGNARL